MLNKKEQKEYMDLLMSYKDNANWKDEFYKYKNSKVPNKLYRYRPINILNLKALKDNYIYLSSPSSFNDIYDCFLNIDSKLMLLDSMLNKDWYKDNPFTKDELEILLLIQQRVSSEGMTLYDFINFLEMDTNKLLNDKLKSSKGFVSYNDTYECFKLEIPSSPTKKKHIPSNIACFTETFDNVLMWAHSAQYKKGFYIEYDISEYENIRNNMYPILYMEEPPFLPELFRDYQKGKVDITHIQSLFTTIKYNEWQYEKEWRLFGRESRLTMPILPSCIYLGVNIKECDKREISKIAENLKIPIKQMKILDGKFKLTIIDV